MRGSKVTFFRLQNSFSKRIIDGEFWKHSQIFLLVASIDGVSSNFFFINFIVNNEIKTKLLEFQTSNWKILPIRIDPRNRPADSCFVSLQLPESAGLASVTETFFSYNTVLYKKKNRSRFRLQACFSYLPLPNLLRFLFVPLHWPPDVISHPGRGYTKESYEHASKVRISGSIQLRSGELGVSDIGNTLSIPRPIPKLSLFQ